MRKVIVDLLNQNGFKFEDKLESWIYLGQSKPTVHHKIYVKTYSHFEVKFYVTPQIDHRFPPTRRAIKPKKSLKEIKYKNDNYKYNKDCVYFKMPDVEINYSVNGRSNSNQLFSLTNKSITYQGIRKLRKLHKQFCPTILNGNWKNLSIEQLTKMLKEFEVYDIAIEKAIKNKKMLDKINNLETDF
jgi:hypothetical protein